jgi:Fibronectin type III domain
MTTKLKGAMISIALLSIASCFDMQAQVYPVQVTTQLVPPYSVYLPDYATPGNDKLKLIVFQRDLTRPSYQIRLMLSIELNGQVILRTSPSFNPPPITLQPGQPTRIEGIDLQSYLETVHLDFVGLSRETYERTKSLPEGSYQICITALDYRRQDVVVSNAGCSFYWLAKSEPPMINLPLCGTDIAAQNPQQIVFNWLPRNTTSPTSALDTEYEFSLYEVRPAGRNPNDVVLSSQPVYKSTTSATQLVYGPADPPLFKDMSYVWRVQAIDKTGRDGFRNNGYSEVCTFNYGGIDMNLPAIQNLVAEGEAERRGKASWMTAPEFTQYKIGYRKSGSGYEWYSAESVEGQLTIQDLEPDTEYEVRVQGAKDDVFGPYSDVATFITSKPKVFKCGDELPQLPEQGPPLLAATIGTTVDVQGLELTFTEVTPAGGAGLFKGKGQVSVPYLGGASFNATFDQLYVDENRIVSAGRIDFITRAVDEWIEEKLEEQRKEELEEQQEENRDYWSGHDFYAHVSYYEDIKISEVRVENGQLVVIGTDALGNPKQYNNDEILQIVESTGKSVIIEDKDGDQWVVQKGGKISKVVGGGLSPNMDVVVDEATLSLVEEALIEMQRPYTPERLKTLSDQFGRVKSQLDTHIGDHNTNVMGTGADESPVESTPTDMASEELKTFVLEGGESAAADIDVEYMRLSIEYKRLETEINLGALLSVIATPDNVKASADVIAPELRIGEKTASEFIGQQKIQHAPKSETVRGIATAIDVVLNNVLRSVGIKNVLFKKIEKN